MEKPVLIIMAAGMGSRYGGNKQLDRISKEGDIIMDFSLYDAYQAGFRRVCFIIKHDFEDVFKAHIEKGAGTKYEVHYAFQEGTDLRVPWFVPADLPLLLCGRLLDLPAALRPDHEAVQ